MNYILKLIITAILVLAVSEISKKTSLLGAIFASIPLVSILGIIWLYKDTKDIERIINLSNNIFWLVLASLIFFVIFPRMLKHNINFYISLIVSIIAMIFTYFGTVKLISKF